MFFLGETKNCSKSFPKTSIDASTDAKVSCLGWTVVASQGHQKLLSSLFLTETSFLSSRTTTHPSIFRRTREHRLGLTSVLLDVPHRSISEFAIVKPGHRLGSRCFAELSSVAVAPPFAPLPRHPRTAGTAKRRGLAGERRAAEGGAVQARCIHRPCSVGGGTQLQLDSTQSTGAPDPATDAAAQRHRSLEHDAQNGLAALFTTGALMALKTGPPRDRHDAIKEKIGLVLALSVGLLSCGSGVQGKP